MRGAAAAVGRSGGAPLLLLTLFLTSAACSPAKFRLCGKNLADILSLVCRGRGFYDPFAAAKPSGTRGDVVQENRVGVSDECCRMGCTEATLESYCAPPSDADYGDTEIHLFGDRRQGTPAIGGTEEGGDAEGPATAEVSTASKVSRGGGVRRKGGGGGRGGGHKRDWEGARGPRGGGRGKRCRCKRRRRKTDADGMRRQVRRPSFQIGTIPPNFLGTPVILPRTKATRMAVS